MKKENRERFFEKEHIVSSSFHVSNILTEQALHCLECVTELNENKLPFLFKGGNSLLVILQSPARFSIDVDIATDVTADEIEQCLNEITGNNCVFKRWEKRQHKTKPWLPMRSYYLHYNSFFTDEGTNSIMLDVQLHKSLYQTEMKPVQCCELFKSETLTEIPVPAGIIGDKLLTLGPLTLGIPLGKGKEAQRLKHVFDISRLLETKPSLEVIRKSINACISQENELQNTNLEIDEIITDTLLMLWSSVSAIDTFKWGNLEIFNEHKKGLEPFAEHLFDKKYSWNKLQIDMSRVALCIAAVGNEIIDDVEFQNCFENPLNTGELPFPTLLTNAIARNYWETAVLWGESFLPEGMIRANG